jgi:hypothetical protein
MKDTIINFDDFHLQFASATNEGEVDEENSDSDSELDFDEDVDASELKEYMESCIPTEAIFLGGIEKEVENWTSWIIQDDYYIIPLQDDKYDWALFRLSWDDNWGTWNWSFDARLAGYKENYQDAAKYILKNLWGKWGIDFKDPENESYNDLINEL